MPTNKTVIPKLLIVLGVVCLSTAVYTPRIQLRTAAIVAAALALSAIGVIAGGVLAFLPV